MTNINSMERILHINQEDDASHSRSSQNNIYKTVIKEKSFKDSSTHFLSTPSPIKKHIYRPITFKLMADYQEKLLSEINLGNGSQSQLGTRDYVTFIVLAKIESVKNQHNRYYFCLADDTMATHSLNIFYLKSNHQLTLNSFLKTSKPDEETVDSLEFEPTKEGGQPYFRIWMKLMIDRKEAGYEMGWSVEKVERVRDYNQVTFHFCSVIHSQLFQL